MLTTITTARRRSLSLSVTMKETDRAPCILPAVRHDQPWNKYSNSSSAMKPRKAITLSHPSKEEFVRIRQWATNKRRQEEQHMATLRRKDASREQHQRLFDEKNRQERLTKLITEIRERQEKRDQMKKEREEAQKQYLLFKQSSRLTPLFHEHIQTEFHLALERMQKAQQELYNQKIKPFRTARPGEIIATNILKEIGKFPDDDQVSVPFTFKRPFLSTTNNLWDSWCQKPESEIETRYPIDSFPLIDASHPSKVIMDVQTSATESQNVQEDRTCKAEGEGSLTMEHSGNEDDKKQQKLSLQEDDLINKAEEKEKTQIELTVTGATAETQAFDTDVSLPSLVVDENLVSEDVKEQENEILSND